MFQKFYFTLLIAFIHLSVFSSEMTTKDKVNFCQENKNNFCATPFGKVLGQFEGIESYSNCRSECVYNEDSAPQELKTKAHQIKAKGLPWQCVEFARRFWSEKYKVEFGSVDTAQDIFEEKFALKTNSNGIKEKFLLHSYLNRSSLQQSPLPQVGDLIIYSIQDDNPEFQYGHVVVVVGVDLKNHFIEIAEQNYDNKIWEKPFKYSRKISITIKNNRCYLQDQSKASIIGWVSFK